MKLTRLTPAALVASLALAIPAWAEEVTLRAISAFQAGAAFAKPFDEFVSRVNERGKGVVQIQLIGGPEAMPPFEIGNALRGNVIDLANTTAVFHANLVPEGVALTLTDHDMATLRAAGGYDLMNEIHEKKAGIHWLGRLTQGLKYHVYLSEPPETESLTGLKLRSVPVYQAFFAALGATPVQIAPGEVFTALERGAVDGYGWPSIGVFDLGWQEKTKARVEPGFYQVETGIFLSLSKWQALTDEQRKVLSDVMLEMEADTAALQQAADEEKARQEEAGIAMHSLPEAAAGEFIALSKEAGWKPVMAASPEYGQRLYDLLAK
jgi:TRAP-type C4-dicarboxylate transport system substrate-binding protein